MRQNSFQLYRHYVLISTSKGHALFIETQKKLYPDKQVKELQSLSGTRWASRSLALKAICSTFNETLECYADNSDKTKAVEAISLLYQVFFFKYLQVFFFKH